jgi:hypothetical protein
LYVVRDIRQITFSRSQTTRPWASPTARADAPGGREADAERFAAVIKALTGKEPRVYRMKDGKIR